MSPTYEGEPWPYDALAGLNLPRNMLLGETNRPQSPTYFYGGASTRRYHYGRYSPLLPGVSTPLASSPVKNSIPTGKSPLRKSYKHALRDYVE